MCTIEIMESILGSTTLVVNICDKISTQRRATIHLEMVKSRCKQVDLISCLSDGYKYMDSDTSLGHIHGHHVIGRPASTLILTSISQRTTGCTSTKDHGGISTFISDNKYNVDRTIGPIQNSKRLYTHIYNPLQHCSVYHMRNIETSATPTME